MNNVKLSSGNASPLPTHDREVRRLWGWLLVGSLIFLTYGSLVPLNYHPIPWELALANFGALATAPAAPGGSSVDWASNFLLTIPISLAAGQYFLTRPRGGLRWLLRGLILAGLLAVSIGVEFSQQFFPPRTPSMSDITAQALGSMVGLVAQHQWGPLLSSWLAGWWQQKRAADRLSHALKLYVAVLAAFSVMPLDLTISPVELYHKWADGRVILLPFAGTHGTLADMAYELLTDLAIWIPVGALLGLSGRRVFEATGRTLLAAAMIELLQLFVQSRTSDVTDILLAGVGGYAGAALFGQLNSRVRNGFAAVAPSTWRLAWYCWLLIVIAIFWFPFDFQASAQQGWSALQEVPFADYETEDEFHALNQLLRKTGFFLPGGLLWGMALAAARQRGIQPATWPTALTLVASPLLVEIGQLFLPSKIASLTDILLELFGGWCGLALARWLNQTPAEQAQTSASPPTATGPGGALREPATRQRPHAPPKQAANTRASMQTQVLVVLALTAFIGITVRLPGVPYNMRELCAVGPAGLLSALCLAITAHLFVNGPLLSLARHSSRWMLAAPAWLLPQGALAFALLRLGVPLESMHDIVGSPVLGWPWEWELLGRFLALWIALSLQLIGGFAVIAAIGDARRLPALFNWAVISLASAGPLYYIIITRAATDNLTELIANDASFTAASCLALGLAALAMAASALSAFPGHNARRGPLLVAALAGSGIAAACFIAGSESTLVKYDKVFSALQFLLSTNREHYAQGFALWLRLAVALGGTTFGIAALQYLYWRGTCQTSSGHAGRRSRS